MLNYNKFSIQEIIEPQPLTVKPETLLGEVITLLSQTKANCVLITENKRLLGIYTERDVVNFAANSDKLVDIAIADVMTKNLICIKQSEITDIFGVLHLMRHHKIRHIPVVNDDNELIGAIALQTLRNCLKPSDMLRLRQVRELMESPVIYSHSETSLLDIAVLMAHKRISCVVISEITPNREVFPVGIITEMDIVRLQAQRLDMAAIKVHTVMSRPIQPIKDSDTLWYANQKMQQMKVRRLVVIDQYKQLCGIVTQTTLLKVLDPLEMQTLINVLQQTVKEKTQQLQEINQDLQEEIKQRQEIELALRESETRYRNMAIQQVVASQKLELINKRLEKMANYDYLTELANRRYFNEYLHQIWQRLSVEKVYLSVIMCDCDYFKNYNDTYGHQAGDKCLFQIAKLLKKTITRPDDMVARYGGEEFVILLPDTTLENAVCVAKRIHAGVTSLHITHSTSPLSNFVTLSLGVASTIPQFNIAADVLIEKADHALYQAKNKGRDRVIAT
ncbi:MAG: diguanylate cyclase [Cyanobacteria bacterium P01_A01_bin.84]